jgi:hypothetical protein
MPCRPPPFGWMACRALDVSRTRGSQPGGFLPLSRHRGPPRRPCLRDRGPHRPGPVPLRSAIRGVPQFPAAGGVTVKLSCSTSMYSPERSALGGSVDAWSLRAFHETAPSLSKATHATFRRRRGRTGLVQGAQRAGPPAADRRAHRRVEPTFRRALPVTGHRVNGVGDGRHRAGRAVWRWSRPGGRTEPLAKHEFANRILAGAGPPTHASAPFRHGGLRGVQFTQFKSRGAVSPRDQPSTST